MAFTKNIFPYFLLPDILYRQSGQLSGFININQDRFHDGFMSVTAITIQKDFLGKLKGKYCSDENIVSISDGMNAKLMPLCFLIL